MEKLFSVKKVAEVLGVTIQSINNWKRERKIPFIKMNGRTMFIPEDIRKWLEANRVCGVKK